MTGIIQGTRKGFQHVSKGLAVAASTGAALVSIITALITYGVVGKSASHHSVGNLGAAWVEVRPAMDTAFAVGDTIRYLATVADQNGSVLVGAHPVWTTADSNVAVVGTDGSVVARGPGRTTITVVVGTLIERANVMVEQHVTRVAVVNPAGDTTAALLEGSQLHLQARAFDARGHPIADRVPRWHIDDTTVAVVDASGTLTGQTAGRTIVTTTIDGVSGTLPVSVLMTASGLSVVAGAAQRALVDHPLPHRVVVRATNRRGGPAPGKLVTFRPEDSRGTVEPATATTDADGRAWTVWTLANTPGRQKLLATVESLDSTLSIDAEGDPVAANTRVAVLADTLRARAGAVLTDSVGVRVTDSTGLALANLPVRWAALAGSVEALDERTDSLGVARARWTLADRTGTQKLQALIGSAASRIAPVTVRAIALAGAPVRVVVVSGDSQQARAGTTLPKSVVLRVVDTHDNGVSDVSVVLSPSGGTVPDTTLVTDASGRARTTWRLGRSAGDYTLAAHVDGIKSLLKLEAHARPSSPANLSFDDAASTSRSSSAAARSRTRKLVARVTDIYGNPVPDVRVTFSVKSGTVTPTRAVTDSRGRVALTWRLGSAAGDQSVRGSVSGTDVRGAYLAHVQAAAPKPAVKSSRTRKKSP